MRSNYFMIGKDLLVRDAPVVIANIVGDGGMYQLSNKHTGRLTNVSREELLAGYARGEVRFATAADAWSAARPSRGQIAFAPPLAALGEKARAETKRRRVYLKKLEERGALRFDRSGRLQHEVAQIAHELEDTRPPHRSTVHRWYRQYTKRQRNLQAIACRFDRRGAAGEGRFSDPVEEIIVAAIDEIYLTEQRNTATETWEVIRERVEAANLQRDPRDPLPVPALRTIQRRIASLQRYEVVARREGERVAKRRFRQVTGMVKVGKILQRVEMDHTPLNLFCVDEDSWLPLGRPDLTVAVDRRSRCLLGYWIGFTGHGVDAVLGCLRHAILPKTYLKERYPHIKLGWPTYGLPQSLWCDNALEFVGEDLKNACDELGIDLFFLPARKPQWKGSVERFLKSFNHSLIHRIPGTTFENITARGDYDPTRHALIGLKDLEKLIHTWVCDVYHNQVHRGLAARPIDVWNRGAEAEEPALPSDIDRLDFQLGESEERTVWHYGIELHGGMQRFNNKDLAAVHAVCGKVRVRVRYHRRSIGKIWVENPMTKEFFEVPNIDPEYARDLSREQHQFIVERAKADATGRVDRPALMAAKAFLRAEIQRLLLSKVLRDRRKGARVDGRNSGNVRAVDADVLEQYDAVQQAQLAAKAVRQPPKRGDGDADPAVHVRPTSPRTPRPTPQFARRDSGAALV